MLSGLHRPAIPGDVSSDPSHRLSRHESGSQPPSYRAPVRPAVSTQDCANRGSVRYERTRPKPTRCGLLRAVLLAIGLSALAAAVSLHPATAGAHGGAKDEWGGHFDESTGRYHYHRPSKSLAAEKQKHLTWVEFEHKGILRGVLERIDRPNYIWLRMENRPAYHELSALISKPSRDDKEQLLQIRLQYVSPEETGLRGRKFSAWYAQKVIYEMKRKLAGKPLAVHFERIEGLGVLQGMVFIGDEEENVNLWLVLAGWSYYAFEQNVNPHERRFVEAEQLAKREKAGIWGIKR